MSAIRPNHAGTPATVPMRRVNEFVYCPRLFYLEWVDSLFVSNDDVEEGLYVHRVVDQPSGNSLLDQASTTSTRATSVRVASERLGVAGVIDVVEQAEDGSYVPVDYKKGHPQDDESPWPTDRIQSILQALALRESGYDVHEAHVWYDETRTRVRILITDESVAEVETILQSLWTVAQADEAPAPLVNSPKCPRCSLVNICLPDELHSLKQPASERTKLRRRIAPDDPAQPLYVTAQGAMVGVSGERIDVRIEESDKASYRMIDVSQVCLFGNITISSQAVRACMGRDIPVLWFSYGGWFSGMAEGLPHKNVELRRTQFTMPQENALAIAQQMIAGKIYNSRTMLRRNSRYLELARVERLGVLVKQAREAQSPTSLLGYEGNAAKLYFESFPSMISEHAKVDVSTFSDNGRARRPPPDPLNALLSFCYALLTKDVTTTLWSGGFDPYYGVFHQPRYGRPALALDLAEEFRPLIADSVVLQVVNNGEVRERDFTEVAGGYSLSRSGRVAVLNAYERRMNHEITHPYFGYKVTYRRALNVQARMLAAVYLGELPTYSPFITR